MGTTAQFRPFRHEQLHPVIILATILNRVAQADLQTQLDQALKRLSTQDSKLAEISRAIQRMIDDQQKDDREIQKAFAELAREPETLEKELKGLRDISVKERKEILQLFKSIANTPQPSQKAYKMASPPHSHASPIISYPKFPLPSHDQRFKKMDVHLQEEKKSLADLRASIQKLKTPPEQKNSLLIKRLFNLLTSIFLRFFTLSTRHQVKMLPIETKTRE